MAFRPLILGLLMFAAGSALLTASCGKPPPPPPPAPACPPAAKSAEEARRSMWADQVRAIRPTWDRKQLEAFLDGIRTHRQGLLAGGAFREGPGPATWFNLYSLDAAMNLYVVWNGEETADGIRSTEVVCFSDLHPKIDPALLGAVNAIHDAPTAQDGLRFDPRSLIRAVNLLHGLGKERALQALRAYDQLSRDLSRGDRSKYHVDEYRILPIVQILFEQPKPFRLGESDMDAPGKFHWPLFPLALVEEVPFMVVSGYSLEGRGERPADRLQDGLTMRAEPLAPRRTALEAADELIQSPAWKALRLQPGNVGRKTWQIRYQALASMASVFALRSDEKSTDCCVDPTEEQWHAAVARAKDSGLVWSPEIQEFILGR